MTLGRTCVVDSAGGYNCDGCSKLPSVDKKRRAIARLIEAVCRFFFDKSRFLSRSARSRYGVWSWSCGTGKSPLAGKQ